MPGCHPALLAAALALAALPAGSGWLAYRAALVELDRRLALRPPLAVVDYRPLAEHLAQGASAIELRPALAGLQGRAARLRAAGYLVLNRAAVDAVPDSYLVPPERSSPPAPAPPRTSAPAGRISRAAAKPAASGTGMPALNPVEAAAVINALTAPQQGERP